MVVLGCRFFELDKERVIYIRNSRRFLPKQMLLWDQPSYFFQDFEDFCKRCYSG